MHRLLHHAHVVVIAGDSPRNPPPTRKRKAPAAAEALWSGGMMPSGWAFERSR
jgi:hypothetical protein